MLANSKFATSVTLTINWKITLLSLCFLPLLCWLGFWQLDRAAEKRSIIEYASQQLTLPPISVFDPSINSNALSQRRIFETGTFLSHHYWLLDNRVVRGKVGYEVIAPFTTETGDVVLVNCGWVQAPARREELPNVSFPNGLIEIHGRWKHIEGDQDRKVNEENATDRAVRIQRVSIDLIEKILEQNIPSGYVQINPESPYAFQAVWKNINVKPEKHVGYAVQWFAMTAALTIALILANTNLASVIGRVWQQKKQPNNNNNGENI